MPDGREVMFNLFDIGGHSLQSKMLPTYCKGSDCILFVYDLTNIETLENLLEWKKKASIENSIRCALIGNKSDLPTKRTVRGEDIKRIEKQLGAEFEFQVSALTGDRVKMMFVAIAGAIAGVDVK